MRSIRTKILCMNISAILLISCIIGSIGILMANSLLKKEAEIALQLMCEKKKEKLDGIFRCIEHSVDIVTSQALEELERSDKIDSLYTEHMRTLFKNVIKRTRGAVSYYFRYNPEIAGPKAGFFWSKERGENEFCEYPCTDLYAFDENDVENVGWYYVPVNAGKSLWLEPYLNRKNDMFMCSYVNPFYSEGKLIGVVGIDVDIVSIMGMINDSNVYESGYGYLINGENRIVFHKDYQTGELRPEKSEGKLEYEVVLENGLTLVMNVDRDEVYSVRSILVRDIVVCVFVAMLVFGTISILVATKITKPITLLTNAVKGFENGVYDTELDIKGDDEIGVLAKNFIDTSRYLKTYTNYISSVAYTDSLTGIKNATAYREAVKVLENKIMCGYKDFGIVVFDANGLKIVNDKYGHEAGNAMLISVANFISIVFKHSVVYRVGGDEFVVILENADFENRDALLEEFEERMEITYFENQGMKLPISVAKGMAVFEEDMDINYIQVFEKADEAMYVNKAYMKKVLAEGKKV